MPIHAVQAAECLCKTSDWNLSYLEVQKMLYISNMLYLGATGEPLVEGSFEAGNYGPVHPVLQCHLQSYGLNPIPKAAFNDFSYDKLDAGKKKILTGTAKHFKKTPKRKLKPKLIAITNQQVSAWKRKYRFSLKGIRILDEDIKEEYENRKANHKQLAEVKYG